MSYVIKRISTDEADGCFGVFLVNGKPACVTLEDHWRNNQKQISCIPAGTYEVEKYSGTKFKNVWIIKNVPNRSAILIHWGNRDDDTIGCVLVGTEYATIEGETGILGSMKAMDKLRKILPNKFTLTIINHF
jgi:hypothetical protein